MKRRKIIIGNWKLNKTNDLAEEFCNNLVLNTKNIDNIDFGISPSYLCLSMLQKYFGENKLIICAQNVSNHKNGAFTGEVSYVMLKNIGIKYVLVGHSERRNIFNETDKEINEKLLLLTKSSMKPIFCIGETREQRSNGFTRDVITKQLEIGLKDISNSAFKNLCIAYEPIWSIGTGETATVPIIENVTRIVRKVIAEKISKKCAEKVRIMYGGSVNPKNIDEIMKIESLDGVLVGGASLNCGDFISLIESISNASE